MARPGRRRFGRSRGVLNRPAGAFAGAERGGKAVQWEALLKHSIPQAITTFAPNIVRTISGVQTQMVTLIPINVLQGPVTLMRVRGTLEVWFVEAQLSVNFIRWPVSVQLQLVGARDGQIDTQSILSPSNSADQESNKIVWQRMYMPADGATISSPSGEVYGSNYRGHEVDIRVKRRFDRANWALALVVQCETNASSVHIIGGRLRGLFKTSQGI